MLELGREFGQREQHGRGAFFLTKSPSSFRRLETSQRRVNSAPVSQLRRQLEKSILPSFAAEEALDFTPSPH